MTSTASTTDQSERIVVGIGDSPSSLAALAWAARQAEFTAVPLTVIVTWVFPTSYGYPVGWPDPAADAKSILDDSVDAVLRSTTHDPGDNRGRSGPTFGRPCRRVRRSWWSAAEGTESLRECCSAR